MKWVALAVSVGVHGLALWWFSSAEVPVVVMTTLAPVSIDVIEIPSPHRGEGQGEGRAKPAPAKRRREVAALAAAPADEPAQVAAAETESDVVEPLTPALSPPGQGEGVSAVDIDVDALVHARLTAAAERCYPAAARRFRQRGTVKLSFCAGPQGSVIDAAIRESSGASLLDAAAQGCVLAQATPLPVEAASRCFSVPVRFGAP